MQFNKVFQRWKIYGGRKIRGVKILIFLKNALTNS